MSLKFNQREYWFLFIIAILGSLFGVTLYLTIDLYDALELSMKMNMDFLEELIPMQTDEERIKDYTMAYEVYEQYFDDQKLVSDPIFPFIPKIIGGN